jgi:hypothetical protein
MPQKAFIPTPKQRRQVEIAAGAGMSHPDIALSLGLRAATLRKYFAHELTRGAKERRRLVLERLHELALEGSVPAIKAYEALGRSPYVTPPAKPEKPGKKTQANVIATTAQQGTEWEGLLEDNRPLQ